jgi:signal transduction histidine kinase
MQTPEKSAPADLQHQIETAGRHSVITSLLQAVGGLVAVLNPQRQIVALNERMLAAMEIDNPQKVMGLRLGEAIGCLHAHDMPAGCGTSEFCSTCGAAVAIVACMAGDSPVQRICALSAERGGRPVDFFFKVQASRLQLGDDRFILLFLEDITRLQQFETLENVFFHDINNTLSSLVAASELLMTATAGEAAKLVPAVRRLSYRMAQEIAMQRYLVRQNVADCPLNKRQLQIDEVIGDVREMMNYHPAARDRNLDIDIAGGARELETDPAILLRVLSNMLINAFEATQGSQAVRLRVECLNTESPTGRMLFSVWNQGHIADDVSPRIFQRNYSTKQEIGRGLGTYSMKLFGEKILGGEVSFETDPVRGTIFRFSLPVGASNDC